MVEPRYLVLETPAGHPTVDVFDTKTRRIRIRVSINKLAQALAQRVAAKACDRLNSKEWMR